MSSDSDGGGVGKRDIRPAKNSLNIDPEVKSQMGDG